jgi:predicted nucleic acid-binding Zn ribbon protein
MSIIHKEDNQMECFVCGKPLKGLKTKYCSKKCKNKICNPIYQSYESQKAKGMARRLKLIEQKGGMCKVCGYKTCKAALTFHHLDPKIKSFEVDMRHCSNHSWKKLLLEADKCDLLCFNCHIENHHGDTYDAG